MFPEPRKNNEPKSFVPKSENSLSNCSRSETVFLQTLCVLIRCQGQEIIIRAVIDSGSQSSYVSEKIMTQLKAFPLRTETVIHALFGGDETEPKSHKVFAIEVSSLNRVFSCGFLAFSEKKICGFIPRIENDEIMNELKRKKKEYLGELVQKHNEKQSRNPQIGEIVLIGDDNNKRLFWPLAKIIELIKGSDGKIRTVKLKTQHGTVLRPIQRIYPLEIYSKSKESVDGELGGEESNSNNVTDNENNVTSTDAVIVRKFTSSGRPVKASTRLDLLNNVCYTLETLFESQGVGGGCCETQ
ncbi:uncharacterized protein NPIL_49611 [Nephila pilipes]|uniref:DUF5641 domain-containing protein n=1 Tax=Nephila pilipes TaxID=299642 RepID=A0A8X6M6U5_NEPPI|nr:uncharacterized protein NPIL_49611 [Nephila pilipes]